MYFLHAINSDRQTRLLNVLGQIAMLLGDKKITRIPTILDPNYPQRDIIMNRIDSSPVTGLE